MIRNSLFIILLCFLSFWPLLTEAAILYLESLSGQYQPGDIFIVEARLDTEGECINIVDANLSFSQDILEAADFSQGNSILTLWAEPLSINQEAGRISFVGGIPNGYCGQMLGTSEKTNLLGKIIFKVEETGNAQQVRIEFLNGSKVFLNDGQGTLAKLITKAAVFNILAEKAEVFKDEWQKEIEKDDILPEEFLPEISKDPTAFEGKYFIIFSTTDKQTGIDHYEIKEGKRNWKIAVSPYVLENQRLTNDIWVKAVDKAGNERVEVLKAIRKLTWKYIIFVILILILVIIGVIWRFVKSVKRKMQNNNNL